MTSEQLDTESAQYRCEVCDLLESSLSHSAGMCYCARGSNGCRCRFTKLVEPERGRVAQATKQSIELAAPKDPTRFLERGFAVVENGDHSIRLIDRNDARQAISIKWHDLPALLELITLMLEDDRPVGPPEES